MNCNIVILEEQIVGVMAKSLKLQYFVRMRSKLRLVLT